MRTLIFKLVRPLVILIGKIHVPYSVKSAAKSYFEILDVIQPGDIILSTTYGHASNLGNPGKFKHAILYIGIENKKPMIIEAIGEGVIKRTLVECIAEKDKIAVIRSNEISQDSPNLKDALKWANSQVGKPYDYDFDTTGNDKYDNFFCSEFCLDFWHIVNPDISFVLMEVFGVSTVSPNDFYNASPKKTSVIFEN